MLLSLLLLIEILIDVDFVVEVLIMPPLLFYIDLTILVVIFVICRLRQYLRSEHVILFVVGVIYRFPVVKYGATLSLMPLSFYELASRM